VPEFAAGLAAAAAILDVVFKISERSISASGPVRLALLTCAAVLLAIWLRDRLVTVSRAARPGLTEHGVQVPAELFGRDRDLAGVVELCDQHWQIHLVGESGVGKSSLLA
jgi:hypothetical protein